MDIVIRQLIFSVHYKLTINKPIRNNHRYEHDKWLMGVAFFFCQITFKKNNLTTIMLEERP